MPAAAILTKRFFTLLSPCWHVFQAALGRVSLAYAIETKDRAIARRCKGLSFTLSFNDLYVARDERSLNGEMSASALEPCVPLPALLTVR
jgi:hypothetical protein